MGTQCQQFVFANTLGVHLAYLSARHYLVRALD